MEAREDRMMRKVRRKARELYDLPALPRIVMSDLGRIWQEHLRTPLGILGTKYMTEGLLDILKSRGLTIVKEDSVPTSDEMQVIQQALMMADMALASTMVNNRHTDTTKASLSKAIGITLKFTEA